MNDCIVLTEHLQLKAIKCAYIPLSFKILAIVEFNYLCTQSSKDLKVYCHNIRSFKCNASKSVCNFSNVDEIPDIFVFIETSFNDGNLQNINSFQSTHTLRFNLCQKPFYSHA